MISFEKTLQAMDIDIWVSRSEEGSPPTREILRRKCASLREAAPLDDSLGHVSSENIETSLAWDKLRDEVAHCTKCPLHKTRTKTVFGVGNIHADLMFIGEAPGAQEDKQGEPFVGRAGQLLDAILHAAGFSRETIYIGNILKSRPPNNRDPLPEEIAACTPFLTRQIALIQPKLLVSLGRIASHFLLNTTASLGSLRGKLFAYGSDNIPLLVTYHPAFLLRSPLNKAKAYEDICLIKQTLETLQTKT